jgi:hypothetical protein
MLKKTFLATAISLCFSLSLFAQTEFQFIEDKHDFGTIIEGTDAYWEFKFKNIGTDTIKLKEQPEPDVRASCGCTTPTWTKVVAPGETGIVSAKYGSAGRPVGNITKNVTVMYKGNLIKVLTISMVVIKADTTKYTEVQLKTSSKISLEKNSYNFGKIEKGLVMTKIPVKNSGKDSLSFLSSYSACNCISYKLMMENKKTKMASEVKSLPAGKSGYLELIYNPSAEGVNTNIITLVTNDKANPRTAITLSAEVVASLQPNSPIKNEGNINPFGGNK